MDPRTRNNGSLRWCKMADSSGGFRHWTRYTFGHPITVEEGADEPFVPSITGYLNDQQSITDISGRKYAYNACNHTKYYPIPLKVILSEQWGNVPSPELAVYGEKYYHHTSLGELKGYLSLDSFMEDAYDVPGAIDPVDWTGLVNGVGERLDGSMEASTNMLVNLAQLSQTVGMIKNPYNLLRPELYKKVKHLSASQAISAVGNSWLEYRYGWRNLFFDIKALASMIKKTRRHMDFLANSGSWVPFHGNENLVVPLPSFRVLWGPNDGIELTITGDTYTRNACFSLDFRKTEAFNKWSRWNILNQYLGMNQMIEALWDLVPFSFIVDWFIDVGRWTGLHPMYWNTSRLRRMGYSLKQKWDYNIIIKSRSSAYNAPDTLQEFTSGPHTVLEKYERVEGFPPFTSGVGIFGGASLTHLADSAALIYQRLM